MTNPGPFRFTPNKAPKISSITLNDLAQCLGAYCREVCNSQICEWDVIGDRSLGTSEIVFWLHYLDRLGRRGKVSFSYDGKALSSSNAKLGNGPIILGVSADDFALPRFELVAIPRADRSIELHKVLRWESGLPVIDPGSS